MYESSLETSSINEANKEKVMKKSFKLTDLDCANCAAKIETAIRKVDGVTAASISFMTQKMELEAADDKFDAVLAEVKKVITKIEPDVSVA